MAALTTNGVHKAPTDEVFVFPATVGQQGFWYLDQIQPGNPAYNIAVRFRLQGSLDVDILTRALNEIVRRHEALRTTIAVVDGVPVQVVAPHLSIAIRQDDLRGDPNANRNERAQAIAAEEGSGPFDLAKGPLIRTRLLRLDNEEHVLLITVHHVISDGWSVGIITDELGVLYDAYVRGLDSPLPDLTLQYGDFAVWQEKWLASNDLREQLSYWTRQLADLPILEVPTDRPRPAVQTFHGNVDSVLLPRELTDRLAALANQEKATPFMVMLAAFKILLQRCCGQDDIYLGSALAGRPRAEVERLIGMFINPLVLRTNLSGDPTFLELLARVRETALQAFAHSDVPFERIVEVIHTKRDPSRPPVFQVNFLYQRAFMNPFKAQGLTVTPIPAVSPGAIYDLNFFLVDRAEGLRASFDYNTDLYDASTIRRLLELFQTLLTEIAANPTGRISALGVTSSVPHSAATVKDVPVALASSSHVAPRDAVEARLAELWEQVLGTQGISVTADFFDVGGHSLLAARLLARIETAFGKKLSLATLLQAPTIESFAARLRMGDSSGPSDQVHAIQPNGSRPPWVVLTSQPQIYRTLAQLLGPDQPVVGLTSPELADLPEVFTVRDVAANLVKALRSAVPHGPYYLGGWCVSGVIAFEMARQLREQGEHVALLAFLDSNCPVYIRKFRTFRSLPARAYFYFQRIAHHIKTMCRLGLLGTWSYLGRGLRTKLQRWSEYFQGWFRSRKVVTEEEQLQRFSELQRQAALEYSLEPTDVPIALFRSEVLQTGLFRDPALGWGPLARGGLTLYEVPGDHDDMFSQPVVEEVARGLTECLRRAATAPRADQGQS